MKKEKKIALIVIICVLIVGFMSGTVLGLTAALYNKQYIPLNYLSREVLAYNFKAVELGQQAELKREISAEKPLNLLNYYGDEDISVLWQSIPENQREYTVLLLIPGHTLNASNSNSVLLLEQNADRCESLKIPYAIQHVNGEIHMEERLPIAYLEERFAKKHQYFYGLNAAELYNGVEWRGEVEADQSFYIINSIKLCAKYGGFFFWTDTNRNYQNGMLLEWLEGNESFYTTFKTYSKYICLLNKESYGDPSTYSVMQGLWLAGLVGNWGVASDWWHWQVDGDKKSLFNQYDHLVDDEWDMIFNYPENMFVQSMMFVMSRGGTCFKAEAPNFSTSINGEHVGGYEYGIAPLFDAVINKQLVIPSKQEVFDATQIAILGKENYVDLQYNFDDSNLYPARGEGGILPLLPSNLRAQERNAFLQQGIKLVSHKITEAEYATIFGTYDANTYLSNCGNAWYYIHNAENAKGERFANFAPNVSGATNVRISSDEHTSAIITEHQDKLGFYVSNYRTDKQQLIADYKGEISAGKSKWKDVLYPYLTLDKNGNPKGVSDQQKRKVTLSISGSYNGGAPQVVFQSNAAGTGKGERPFEVEEVWDPINGVLTLTIMQNGTVTFDVLLDGAQGTAPKPARASLTDDTAVFERELIPISRALSNKTKDFYNYTYYSYLNYDRAYGYAQTVAKERSYAQQEVDQALAQLQLAQKQLVSIAGYEALVLQSIDALQEGALRADQVEWLEKSLDLLLFELAASQEYSLGRGNQLTYAQKLKNCSRDTALKTKQAALKRRYATLQKRANWFGVGV